MVEGENNTAAPCVDCVVEGRTGWLILNNQPKLNAITPSMWRGLKDGIARHAADPGVRCVVVTGAGGKAFTTGADLSSYGHASDKAATSAFAEQAELGMAALRALADLSKPTIAMIDGLCLGGGAALALRCDMRIASETARFSVPVAARGLSYDFDSIRRLIALIGPSATKDLLFTARKVSAAEALRVGLYGDVLPQESLRAHVSAVAETIGGNAPMAIAAAKAITDMAMRPPAEWDLAFCEATMEACMNSADFAEATRAFNEKRPPLFQGR